MNGELWRPGESVRNRLVGIAIGLAVAAVVLCVRFAHPPPAQYPLLNEDAGRIQAVAIQYTQESAPDCRPALAAFFRQASPDIEVIAMCGNSADAADFAGWVRAAAFANSRRFHTVIVGASITGWCKDRFLVTKTSPISLVCPTADAVTFPGRANDALVAPALQHAYPARFHAVEVPLHFDSGDILATGSSVIVNDELASKNGGRPTAVGGLEKLFGRRIVWLTGSPPHHIGMFAAALGGKTVLVGDPSLASLANATGAAEPDEIGQADFSPRIQALFDTAAKQLAGAGFRVVRAPEIYLGPKTYITYTNAVLETDGGKKVVYMPWYGIPNLDESAKRVYEQEGWTVRPIPVQTLYKYRGTIGCLINVLERAQG